MRRKILEPKRDLPSRTPMALNAIVTIATSVLACVGVANAQSGYIDQWFTMSGPGGISQDAVSGYVLSGTIGQPAAGLTGSDPVLVNEGFWVATQGLYLAGVGDDDGRHDTPLSLQLHAVSPNPLIDHTTVSFDLPRPGAIDLLVYDVSGRRRRILAAESFPAGRHQRAWDGTDDNGHRVEAGIYFIEMDSPPTRMKQRVVVLR